MQMDDEDRFCMKCGANSGENIQTINTRREGIAKYFALGMALLCIALLFLKWFHIPVAKITGSGGSYSLIEMIDLSGDVNDIIGMGNSQNNYPVIPAFIILIMIIGVAVLVCNVVFCFKLLINYKNSTAIGKAAFLITAILPLILIIISVVINRYVFEETQGFIKTITQITAVPVIMLVIGLAGRFIMMKLIADEINGLSKSGGVKSFNPASRIVICQKCGFKRDSDQPFCPVCKAINKL
jgi:hypothetical protein